MLKLSPLKGVFCLEPLLFVVAHVVANLRMAEQRKNKSAAANVASQRRQRERPDEVLPGQRAVEDQVKNLNAADNDMGGIGERNQPGHHDDHHDFAAPAAGNIHTMVATSQPEIIALANISDGVFSMTFKLIS